MYWNNNNTLAVNDTNINWYRDIITAPCGVLTKLKIQ